VKAAVTGEKKELSDIPCYWNGIETLKEFIVRKVH
jgi:hypothetical protein